MHDRPTGTAPARRGDRSPDRLTGPDPWFLLPVLLASLLVIAVAALVGGAFPTRRYPLTWN
jgi:hypothetical protein